MPLLIEFQPDSLAEQANHAPVLPHETVEPASAPVPPAELIASTSPPQYDADSDSEGSDTGAFAPLDDREDELSPQFCETGAAEEDAEFATIEARVLEEIAPAQPAESNASEPSHKPSSSDANTPESKETVKASASALSLASQDTQATAAASTGECDIPIGAYVVAGDKTGYLRFVGMYASF
jgi:hypothetical protein